jgi:diguanylate cyclase
MSEDEFKKKMANTLKHYESQVDDFEQEVKTLRQGVEKLCVVASGFDSEVDKKLANVKQEVKNNADAKIILSEINRLVKFSLMLDDNSNAQKNYLKEAISVFVESFEQLQLNKQEKKSLNALKATGKGIKDDELFHLFNQSLDNIVVNLAKSQTKVSGKQNKLFQLWQSQPVESVIEPEELESIGLLFERLSIPQELSIEVEKIKKLIVERIRINALRPLIDDVAELVIETFDFDQKKVKDFLQALTRRLVNVEKMVNDFSKADCNGFDETVQLESSIEEKVAKIKASIDTAESIDSLGEIVIENLDSISTNVQQFKENTKKRLDEFETKMANMKGKLHETEISAEELKLSLSLQMFKANHDSLTKLPNRQSYDEHIVDAINRHKRGYGPLSLAVCDIDHFKKINDTYGHLAGDKVLKKLARVLKSSLRAVDFVARYGGEEFVLILENTPVNDAKNVLEKIRIAISQCEFHFKEQRIQVTSSFGVTEFNTIDTNESIFKRADDALYQAKQGGRNKVCQLE